MSKVLYISYDGMTDPLGQSQVIPYLQGLAKEGHSITVLSAEKPGRFNANKTLIKDLLGKHGIRWEPVLYTKWPPVISTLYDIYHLRQTALRLNRKEHFDIVHCRSYISALIGLHFKRKFGTAFIFDMRGFWADERIDGGLWNLKNPLFRNIYDFFKKKEREFLTEADSTISLTYNARQEILSWPQFKLQPIKIEVIPCCADLNLYKPQPLEVRSTMRKKLGIKDDEFVWVYIGSIGTWYMLDEMLGFFKSVCHLDTKMKFLFVTTEAATLITSQLARHNIAPDDVIITQAPRLEVPAYLSAADASIFFILRTFSKKASSPVKHAEMLGSHLLLITNSGVGDVDMIIKESHTGVVINSFSNQEYVKSYEDFKQLKASGIANFDLALKQYYDLNEGIKRYAEVYKSVRKDT